MTSRWLMACAVLTGCVTVAPPPAAPPPSPPDPSAQELACAQSLRRDVERLASETLTACTRDLDCREVSPLVAGKCGAFVNIAAFSVVRSEFDRSGDCGDVTLVVPRCPVSRPICVSGRCTGEPASEIEDACAEQTQALEKARAAANVCARDEECVALTEKTATNVSFVERSAGLREAQARVCMATPPRLFVAPDEPISAFCVSGRCQTDRQFSTTVRSGDYEHRLPAGAQRCLLGAFEQSISDRSLLRGVALRFHSTIDVQGRLNEFEFTQNVPFEIQAALAGRLRECNVGAVMHRGKPFATRWTFTLVFED